MSDLLDADLDAMSHAVTALRCATNEIKRLAEEGNKHACPVTAKTIAAAVAGCERIAGKKLPHCKQNPAPEVQPTAAELEMRRSNKPPGDYKVEASLDGKESNRHLMILAYWNGSTLHWGREHVRIASECKPRIISGPLVALPLQWLESISKEPQP